MSDSDDIVIPTNSGAGLRWVALVSVLAPFVLNFSSGSSVTVNGVTVSEVSHNYVALIGGAVGVLGGLILVPLGLRAGSERNKSLAWAGLILVLGAYWLVLRSGFLL